MSKFSYWLKQVSLDSFFPWGHENYRAYFASGSNWVTSNNEVQALYTSTFNEPLSAVALARQARSIEHEHEMKNSLEPFSWDSLQISDADRGLMYLAGKVDICSDEVLGAIWKHRLVILHEPFNFAFNAGSKLYGEDYSAIAPCQELLSLNQQYINDRSIGKPTAALHIRRGDYQDWNNGRYFYDDDFWVEKVSGLIKDNFQPWVFSNDLTQSLAEQLNAYGAIISNGSFEDDLVRLMLMDRVSGPPSTFSWMAVKISKCALGLNPVLEFFNEK